MLRGKMSITNGLALYSFVSEYSDTTHFILGAWYFVAFAVLHLLVFTLSGVHENIILKYISHITTSIDRIIISLGNFLPPIGARWLP